MQVSPGPHWETPSLELGPRQGKGEGDKNSRDPHHGSSAAGLSSVLFLGSQLQEEALLLPLIYRWGTKAQTGEALCPMSYG